MEDKIPFDTTSIPEDFEGILDQIAIYQIHILMILKHSTCANVEILSHSQFKQIMKEFDNRAQKGRNIEVT